MKRARGFTLVELIVAITLSVMVLGGLMSVFYGAKTSFQSTNGVGNMTEGGRFAIDFVSQALRGAGIMGCTTSSTTDVANLALADLRYQFAQPMSGYEAGATAPGNAVVMPAAPVAGGAWLPALDPLLAALPVPPVGGSDVLVVHTSLPQTAGIYVTGIIDAAPTFTVANAAVPIVGPGTLQAGGLALITDCTKATVFEMTGVAGNTITHTVGGGAPGNATTAFAESYSPGAMVYVPDTVVYYIGIGADGDGALYSVSLNGAGVFGAPRELVSDIESFQVLFGVDTVGNNTVTQYFQAQRVPAANFNSVVSVQIAFLAASPANVLPPLPAGAVAQTYNLLGTTITAPVDRRVRRVFQATVAVRGAAT